MNIKDRFLFPGGGAIWGTALKLDPLKWQAVPKLWVLDSLPECCAGTVNAKADLHGPAVKLPGIFHLDTGLF